MKEQFSTPILFLCFNRPEQTQRVFDSIRTVKPKKLYVAIDGAREGRKDDIENSNKVKEIVHNVDWPCETHYLEHEKNLGCSKSGVTAWKWFFEQEDRMLFIEDDGLGNESAFNFVEEMLSKYQNDERVAYVGAVNYGPKYGDSSYFFSREPAATYFMGTWKRVFEKYEYEIESYFEYKRKKSFIRNFNTLGEYLITTQRCEAYLRSIQQGKRQQTYDIQMIYLSYKYGMVSVYPNINMVSNIGLDGGANNHVDVNDPFYKEYANRERFELKEIIHPKEVYVDKKFEKEFYKKRVLYLKPWFPRWIRTEIDVKLPFVRRLYKKLFKHER